MKLLKQFQAGRWFIFWTMDEKSYTALDPSDMRWLKGPDPQELIRQLIAGEDDEATPKPRKRAKKG